VEETFPGDKPDVLTASSEKISSVISLTFPGATEVCPTSTSRQKSLDKIREIIDWMSTDTSVTGNCEIFRGFSIERKC
jgi:hypothetical protein